MANIYDLGDLVQLKGNFTSGSVYVDPSIIELRIRNPLGAYSSYTYASGAVKKSTTGRYYMDLFVNDEGQWWYRFYGSGTVIAADENYFVVEPSEFP